jgi:hypothetical protein
MFCKNVIYIDMVFDVLLGSSFVKLPPFIWMSPVRHAEVLLNVLDHVI